MEMKLTRISPALVCACFAGLSKRYDLLAFGRFVRLVLLASMVHSFVYAESADGAGDLLMEKARKHIREKTPKGMTALKDPEVVVNSRDSLNEVVFNLELECDEPRYAVRDLQIDGDEIPGKVQQKLQLEGVGTRYLFKTHGKGDLKTIQGKFNIRSDGSPGTITAFLPESVGFLRSEQADLPVDGDAAFLAAKASAETRLEEIRKARTEKATAVVSGFFNGIKTVATTVGTAASAKGAEFKTNIDAAARILDAAIGQPASATQPAPVAVSVPAAAPAAPAAIPSPVLQPAAPQVPAVVAVTENAKSAASPDLEWLTPEQAAKKLQISESDVLNAIAKGEIKAKKIGPVWRIPAKELQ
jgi:excisionase family DNA binding protein